jgi:hypothetical protein
MAINGGFGIAGKFAAHDNNVAVHFRFGPELDIAHDGDDIAVHFAIYVNAPHHSNRRVAHFPSYMRAAEDGNNRIINISSAGRGTEDRDDGISVLARWQISFSPDRNNGLGASVAMVSVAVMTR